MRPPVLRKSIYELRRVSKGAPNVVTSRIYGSSTLGGEGNDVLGVLGQKIRLGYVKYKSERIGFVSIGDGNINEYACQRAERAALRKKRKDENDQG
jgi:hypothetical protein